MTTRRVSKKQQDNVSEAVRESHRALATRAAEVKSYGRHPTLLCVVDICKALAACNLIASLALLRHTLVRCLSDSQRPLALRALGHPRLLGHPCALGHPLGHQALAEAVATSGGDGYASFSPSMYHRLERCDGESEENFLERLSLYVPELRAPPQLVKALRATIVDQCRRFTPPHPAHA